MQNYIALFADLQYNILSKWKTSINSIKYPPSHMLDTVIESFACRRNIV